MIGQALFFNQPQNSAGTQRLALHPVSEGSGRPFRSSGGASARALLALLAACLVAFFQTAPVHAQEHRSRVPIVGKLTSGNQRQAFSGKVQSVDLKQKILNVNALKGMDSEIFPVKKNVHVEDVDGRKMKLTALTPGMTVLIYYNQKSGERTVKNIVVLSSGKSQEKGGPAPSS